MSDWSIVLPLLAQDAGGRAPAFVDWIPLMLIGVVFIFLFILPQRREQKKHEQMLGSLKKNDRVLTTGGILGVVANISADGREITLKVDDSSSTRIKFLRSAILRKLDDDTKDDAAKPS